MTPVDDKLSMQEKYRKTYGPAMALLCAVALVLSVILTLHSLSGMGLVGCGTGSSCNQVTASRWSLVMGFLPVSSLAVGAYLALLVCIVFLFFDYDTTVRKVLLTVSVTVGSRGRRGQGRCWSAPGVPRSGSGWRASPWSGHG